MSRAHIFIRNDDVWTLDKEFRFFFDLAMEHRVPVVHAVIPGKMDKELVRFLCRAKEKEPGLLDIVQHGWEHVNYSLEGAAGRKYEFGPLRNKACQWEDIRRGLVCMRSAFGDNFTNAFVPPFHGYDEATMDILAQEKFQLFSAGKRNLNYKHSLIELPAIISFTHYAGDGTYSVRTCDEIIEQLVRNMNSTALSGVLTHHSNFFTAASRRELTRFVGHIALSMEKKIWRVLLFSQLLSRSTHCLWNA